MGKYCDNKHRTSPGECRLDRQHRQPMANSPLRKALFTFNSAGVCFQVTFVLVCVVESCCARLCVVVRF